MIEGERRLSNGLRPDSLVREDIDRSLGKIRSPLVRQYVQEIIENAIADAPRGRDGFAEDRWVSQETRNLEQVRESNIPNDWRPRS